MVNGFMYTTFSNEDGSIKISGNWDDKREKYYGMFIVFNENTDCISWDNEDFLYNDLLLSFKHYMNRTLSNKDNENFEDIEHLLNEDFVEDAIELLEESKKFFFK